MLIDSSLISSVCCWASYLIIDGNLFSILVFDLGDGTFDVSLLSIEDGAFKVLPTGIAPDSDSDLFMRRLPDKLYLLNLLSLI